MEGHDNGLARRTVLMSAGVGLAAGLAGLAPVRAGRRSRNLEPGILGRSKGGVKLNPWRKRVGAPKPGEKPLPILFLVHGSSNSTRSSYDLVMPPGKGEYSMMNVFAREGYDVWTMDHDGYGYSQSSGNNSDIASGVEDLKAAMPVLTKETGQTRMHMYGTSSGAIRAAAFAQAQPDHRRPARDLSAFTYKGDRRRGDRAAAGSASTEFRANPRRKRDESR